jgi:hypothetical protein
MDCEAFRDDMLDVLYGEGGEAAARRFEVHQTACADCRREMAQLRALRGDLAHWRLPEKLGAPAPAPKPRLSWALAAAASLVLALGASLALSGAEVRYDASGLSVRLGRGGSDTRALLEAQERRQRQEIDALRAQVAAVRPVDQDALMRAVSDMIRESEVRHDAAIQASLRDLRERTDAQRQYDLARVSAGLSYLDGKAGLQAARTTELMGHLLQASQQK